MSIQTSPPVHHKAPTSIFHLIPSETLTLFYHSGSGVSVVLVRIYVCIYNSSVASTLRVVNKKLNPEISGESTKNLSLIIKRRNEKKTSIYFDFAFYFFKN